MEYLATFNVTAENIANGAECDVHRCPVALAMLQAGFQEPYVGHYQSKLFGTHANTIGRDLKTQPAVGHWMQIFDAGRPVLPVSLGIIPGTDTDERPSLVFRQP